MAYRGAAGAGGAAQSVGAGERDQRRRAGAVCDASAKIDCRPLFLPAPRRVHACKADSARDWGVSALRSQALIGSVRQTSFVAETRSPMCALTQLRRQGRSDRGFAMTHLGRAGTRLDGRIIPCGGGAWADEMGGEMGANERRWAQWTLGAEMMYSTVFLSGLSEKRCAGHFSERHF